jgi:hypothetical protein
VQPESTADVIEDQRRAAGIAEVAPACREGRIDQLLVVPGVVLERGDDDSSEVAASLGSGGMRAPRPLRMNCGYSGGSGPAD